MSVKQSIIIMLIAGYVILASSVFAAEESATAAGNIDPDTIKENIKRRIEQVVREQRTERPQKRIAYIGTINSITPNSITLETIGGGIEQASTSANTVYLETKTNRAVSREDASIGDFVAALGFKETNIDVLDARRLLILRDPPPKPKMISFLGTVTKIDTQKKQLTLASISEQTETKLFTITTKASITMANPNNLTNQEITLEEINLGQQALVIYIPAPATTSASPVDSMLIRPSN